MNKNLAFLSKGTPVNAVNASKTLTISGVVIDGETVTINNSNLPNSTPPGKDVYEFLADVALTKTLPTNKAVDINAYVTKATGLLTVDTQPTAGDTMTIGGKLYTFIANDAVRGNGKIRVGSDLATAQANILAAINGTDTFNTPNPKVTAGAFASDDSIITALVGGVAGDAIATTETFTAVTNIFAAGILGSGADCSAANAVTALVAAITALDTQGVGAVDGAGDTVVLTADVAGEDGNRILLAKTMANGSFAASATKMSGGVDGTIGKIYEMLVDASYLYLCVADNLESGKNWRRVSIGSAF